MPTPDRPMNNATRIRRWWTEEEDEVLCREADYQLAQGSLRDWNRIAAKLPGRTNKDCRKRWSKVCKDVRKGAWSSAEDQRLQHAVAQNGYRWTHVAETVGTRHADQCAKRWQHFLDPNLDHSEWMPEDDERLIAAVEKYGRKWKIIGEKEFPGRSATDLKNRHVILERKRSSSNAANTSSAAAAAAKLTEAGLSKQDSNGSMPSLTSSNSSNDDTVVDFNDFDQNNMAFYSGSVSPATQTASGLQTPFGPNDAISGPPGMMTQIKTDLNAAMPPMIQDLDDSSTLFASPTHTAFDMLSNAPGHGPFVDGQTIELDGWQHGLGHIPQDIEPSQTQNFQPLTMKPGDMELGGNAMSPMDTSMNMDFRTSTLVLEDVQQDVVNNIMGVLFASKSKVRMKMFTQE